MSVSERRSVFVYEAARLQAIAVDAPVVPERPYDETFRSRLLRQGLSTQEMSEFVEAIETDRDSLLARLTTAEQERDEALTKVGLPPEAQRVTHGRHCPCSGCRREDWTRPELAPCGMHGPDCPAIYAPACPPTQEEGKR